jgi:hypothetical protein
LISSLPLRRDLLFPRPHPLPWTLIKTVWRRFEPKRSPIEQALCLGPPIEYGAGILEVAFRGAAASTPVRMVSLSSSMTKAMVATKKMRSFPWKPMPLCLRTPPRSQNVWLHQYVKITQPVDAVRLNLQQQRECLTHLIRNE